MEITTKETSELLIAAGMPVPDVKVGQVWYNDLGFASVIIRETDSNFIAASLLDGEVGNDFSERQIKSFCIPAFTATDILQELGNDFNLMFEQSNFAVNAKKWVVTDLMSENEDEYGHDNPAEAAALAFISSYA